MTKLFDAAKHLVDVARVLTEDTRFQGQRIFLAGAVSNLAKAIDILIGIYLDNRTIADGYRPHVCDFEFAWT